MAPPPTSWRAPPPTGPRLGLQGAGLALLPVRAIEVAGREIERDALWDALERVGAGPRRGRDRRDPPRP
ncbi:MAG: hypothetical protein ABMB14_39865, partial [Myxococcota bacterium]